MKPPRLLLLLLCLSIPGLAQTVGVFSDADLEKTLRNSSRTLFFSVSPSMPLSVEALKEIRGAASDLKAELVVLADPAAPARELSLLGESGIRFQRSRRLLDLGIQLHYPSLLVSDGRQLIGRPIAGFKSRPAYVVLVSDLLRLRWTEEFRVSQRVKLPRPMSAFFKPIYGTDLIVGGISRLAYVFNLKTGKAFDIPNDDWSDPGASPDGEFITLLGFAGLAWFSTADVLSGRPDRLLKDPGLQTYQSMGQIAPQKHRVLGALSSSSYPAGLIVRDHEKRARLDGGVTVAPLTEWRRVCDGKTIAIPMMSKTGRFLSGTHGGTMKVFRIGPNASECEQVFDSKVTSGKADFSIDDRYLVYVSLMRNTQGINVDAVILADLQTQQTKPIYYGSQGGQLAFPGFNSADRILVYDQTAKEIIQIDQIRRIEN